MELRIHIGTRGYRYDTETGLYYLQSRYYSPDWGRFINADDTDILTQQHELLGKNLFAYCRNNPINLEDSSGNWGIKNPFTTFSEAVLTFVLLKSIQIQQTNARIINAIKNMLQKLDNKPTKINNVVNGIKKYLGKDAKAELNEFGELVIKSKDGLTKVRFDLKHTTPHENSHGHVEVFKNVKNKVKPIFKSGPIYPKDVPHK